MKRILPVLLLFVLSAPAFAANPAFVAFYSNNGLSGGGGNATVASVVLAAGTNRRIVVGLGTIIGVTTIASGISGATGATFTRVGTGAGGGSSLAEMWCSTGTLSSETVTITVALNAATENAWTVQIWIYDNVDNTTPCENFAAVASGTANQTSTAVTAGNAAVGWSIDTNNNRTLTTSCTGSTDVSTFGSVGISAAHCDNQASPNVFNWGANTNVIAAGSVRASGGGAATPRRGTLLGVLP